MVFDNALRYMAAILLLSSARHKSYMLNLHTCYSCILN
nr:MAG TPA: hypothetical protein [Caudoviricetes sp.]